MSRPADRLPDWSRYRGLSSAPYDAMRAPASLPEPEDVEWADYAKSILEETQCA